LNKSGNGTTDSLMWGWFITVYSFIWHKPFEAQNIIVSIAALLSFLTVFQQSEKLKKKTCLVREAPTPSSVFVEASVSKVIIIGYCCL